MIRYDGARGVVWKVKYRDADGRQVKETLGRASDGWSKRKADAALRARLTDVARNGLRKIEPATFASFAEEWLDTYPDAKGLKRSTREGYEMIVRNHLVPAFGTLRLDAVTVERLDAWVAEQRRKKVEPRTVNRRLNVAHLIFQAALRRRPPLCRENPVALVDRPKEPRRRWTILSPQEVAAVDRAFVELAASVEGGEERRWREQARVVFLTVMYAGLRRGEVMGLRWRDVDLADPDGARLRVRETFVRGASDTPKSEKGERTMALGKRLSEELWQHRRVTAFAGDDDLVFCHPSKGTPLDPKRYAVTLRAALAAGKVERPMRPFHDGRHTSITNAAAAGMSPAALMARAGHSDFTTTQLYIDLAGETFRDETELLERRLAAGTSTEFEGTPRRRASPDSFKTGL